jgi:uncharacterized delta-60 repeat protein
VTALALAPGNRIWVAYHGLYQGGINAPFNDVGTHLVLLNQYGFLEPSFEVTFTGTGSIDSLAVDPDGRLLAAGTFEMVNGVARRGVVRLFPDGRMDPSFDPGTGVLVRPWYGRVNGLAYQADGRILLAGEFEQVNAVTRIGVVRLARDGSVDLTFDHGRGLGALELRNASRTTVVYRRLVGFDELDGHQSNAAITRHR